MLKYASTAMSTECVTPTRSDQRATPMEPHTEIDVKDGDTTPISTTPTPDTVQVESSEMDIN